MSRRPAFSGKSASAIWKYGARRSRRRPGCSCRPAGRRNRDRWPGRARCLGRNRRTRCRNRGGAAGDDAFRPHSGFRETYVQRVAAALGELRVRQATVVLQRLDQHRVERLYPAVHQRGRPPQQRAAECPGHPGQLRVPERDSLPADLAPPVSERRHHRRLQQLLRS